MALTKRNPRAGGPGARKAFDQLTIAIASDDIDPTLALQLKKLERRFRLEPHIAALIAELAFQQPGRRA
jgi:hypothetical protein